MKNRSVYALAIAAIIGACVFVLTNPELVSVASGSGPQTRFKPGDVVQFEGRVWVIEGLAGDYASPRYQLHTQDGKILDVIALVSDMDSKGELVGSKSSQ